MTSPDGRHHLVFNGEIYNHLELRGTLVKEGHRFLGTSDTEVLMHLFQKLGPSCLDLLDGMYAFAVYDSHEERLFCARDPLGEKPLYIVHNSSVFAFASEVRALLAAGVSTDRPSLPGIGLLLRQGSIPPPYTHIEDVEFLAPGTWLTVNRASLLRRVRYWHPPYLPEDQAGPKDIETASGLVLDHLRRSAKRRLRSDVPVAAFLSSGLDSAAVCALLVDQGATNLKTFTVTLPDQDGNEGPFAREIAHYLGTDHTEIPVPTGGDWIDEAITAMDVPSVDGVNSWLISRAVRGEGIKVAVSGLGGDELFCGYSNFQFIDRLHKLCSPLRALRIFRSPLSRLATSLPASPRAGRILDSIAAGSTVAALYYLRRSLFSASEVASLLAESALSVSTPPPDAIARLEHLGCPSGLSTWRQVSFFELSAYMHDQLLRDTDCMSMAHGLEVRLPLISRDLVETVTGLPTNVLRGAKPKNLLVEAMRELLPLHLIDRPKLGFSLNLDRAIRQRGAWERSPHRNLFKDAFRRERQQFLSGKRNFARVFSLRAVSEKTNQGDRSYGPGPQEVSTTEVTGEDAPRQ